MENLQPGNPLINDNIQSYIKEASNLRNILDKFLKEDAKI
jgi:hypothetical protein